MADDDHRPPIQARKTTDDSRIIGKQTISVQLLKIGKDSLNIIEAKGAPWVACELRYLPGRERRKHRFCELSALGLQPFNLSCDIELAVLAGVAQRLNLGFQLGDWLFEIQVVVVHGLP